MDHSKTVECDKCFRMHHEDICPRCGGKGMPEVLRRYEKKVNDAGNDRGSREVYCETNDRLLALINSARNVVEAEAKSATQNGNIHRIENDMHYLMSDVYRLVCNKLYEAEEFLGKHYPCQVGLDMEEI